MKKYEYIKYPYTESCSRTAVIAHDTVFIAYITMGGSGFNIITLNKNESWFEGPDEVLGVYNTRQEAANAIKEYINAL